MIMVRRNELACRDEWSRSLWAAVDPVQDAEELTFQRPTFLGPLPPAADDDLRALARADRAASSSPVGEDVLLSEARIVSEHHEPPKPISPMTESFDPRTAVFRARERYRDRNRAKETAARKSGAATPIVVGSAGGEDPAEFRGDDWSQSADRHEADLAPERPAADQRPESSPKAITPAFAQEGSDSRTLPGASDRVPPAVTGHEIAVRPELEWTLERLLAEGGEPDPESPSLEPELTLGSLRDLDEKNLPAWFRTDLPHICRTCRDYRPAADGRRGWCANSWAFTHRRMVHEDDAAPCDSSIGDWWVAVDDVWLVAADVSSHSRATPLLDRVSGKERAARKGS